MNKIKRFLSTTKGKIIAGAVTLLVIAAVIVTVILANRGYRSIIIDALNGTTTVSSREAFKGQNLKNGDNVAVGEKSDLTLALDTDKHVYAAEKTRFRVEAAGKSGINSRTVIHLEEGSVLSEIDNKLADEESYIVETPNATMAVRGTKFKVSAEKNLDDTSVTVVEVEKGEVAVTDKQTGEEYTLSAGENRTLGRVYQDEEALAVEAALEAYFDLDSRSQNSGSIVLDPEFVGGQLDNTNFERVTGLAIMGKRAVVELDGYRCGKGDVKEITPDNAMGFMDYFVKFTVSTDGTDSEEAMAKYTGQTNYISDISFIKQMPNLKNFSIAACIRLSDLSPVAGHSELESFTSVACSIADLSPLGELPELETLSIFGGYIKDFSPLSWFTDLKNLTLMRTGISDITPLTGLTDLTALHLSGSNIPEADMERLKAALPNCEISN